MLLPWSLFKAARPAAWDGVKLCGTSLVVGSLPAAFTLPFDSSLVKPILSAKGATSISLSLSERTMDVTCGAGRALDCSLWQGRVPSSVMVAAGVWMV